MSTPALFLCPRLLRARPMLTSARHLPPAFAVHQHLRLPLRALSTAPARSDVQQSPPPPLLSDSPRPTSASEHPARPPLSIPHHDATHPSRPQSSSKPRQGAHANAADSDADTAALAGRQYGYHISRTSRGSEPVYNMYVRKTRLLTLVRLVRGNSEKLRQDLLAEVFAPLGLGDDRLYSRVRMPGHLEFRGHWREEIVSWMREKGF